MDRTTVWLDKKKRDRVVELTGIPFSEWLRDQVDGCVSDHDTIEAGKTQVDPKCFTGGDAA